MAAIPSLTQAFSALGNALKVPSASSFGSPSFVPPTLPAPKISTANMSPLGSKPAVPNMSMLTTPAPNMSTVTGPKVAPAPTVTPTQPKVTVPPTPTIPPAPTAPAAPSQPSSPYVKTPSGLTVDPNTGAVISGGDTSVTANNQPIVPQPYASYGSYGGGTPGSTAPGGGASNYDPLVTSPQAESAFSAYQGTLVPTEDELATQKKLNDLTTAAATAYTNTENQAIPLEFITGQKAALQRSQSALATPLTAQLSLLQAKRQMASTASKAALDRLDTQVAARRELAKPVSTAYGGTLSRYNPTTGQYETVVNPFGTASGTGVGDSTDITQLIGQAISEGRITADQVTRYGIPFIAQTLKSDPGYNFITQKASIGADTASLKTQQLYADSTDRAFKTANANLGQLVQFMQTAGINTGSTVPIINELQNKVKAGLTDPGAVAAFQAALAGLRAEYAQVLSRGGEVTEGQRAQAASLIPDNLTPQQLQQVADRLNIEGTNAVKEAQQKVKDIQNRLKSNPGGSNSSSSSSSSSGSIYDF